MRKSESIRSNYRRNNRRWLNAFTLIELLVVIAIIAVLIALLLPAVQAARESSRRSQCSNHMKQLLLASHACEDSMTCMPQFGFAWPRTSIFLKQSSTFWSILPYLERQELFDSLPTGQTSSAYFNGSSRLAYVPAYTCPADASGVGVNGAGATWNLNSYNVNGQVWLAGLYPRLDLIKDGTANTVMYVEHIALCRNPAGGNSATDGRSVWPAINLTTGDPIVYWPGASTTTSFSNIQFPGGATKYPTAMIPDPANNNVQSWKLPQAGPTLGTKGNCDPLTSNGMHPAVVVEGMADGSVHPVSSKIALATWNALLTPKGAETITGQW
jgi:prepilin-type N-terminal cleavage/methylation domain-containing protein